MTEHSGTESSQNPEKDNFAIYLDDIRQIPVLSQEEERRLAQKCASGDEAAIRQMVKANLRLVIYVAKEYTSKNIPLLDLIQEGSIGLLTAAKRFDYTSNFRFSTYATKWIRHGILRYLEDNHSIIRIPHNTAEKIQKVETEKTKLFQQFGMPPTTAQIADTTGIPTKTVNSLLQVNPQIYSLDAEADSGDLPAFSELVEDREAVQPYAALVRRELESTLSILLNSLNKRQQEIIKMHFGIDHDRVYSLDEISEKFGVSKERVRQIEHQAILKLQTLGIGMGLEDYLYE